MCIRDRQFSEYATCEPRADQRYPEPWHTPLAWAVASGNVAAVRALLDQGADLIVSPDGRRPNEIATANGHEEIARRVTEYERVEETQAGRMRLFFRNACPDHAIRGVSAHATAINAANRMIG